MIITRTPYRISLAGGGSDFPSYFHRFGGSVVGFALTQYCHISVRELPPYFEYKTRVSWSKLEHVQHNSEIEHPAIRAILSHYWHNDTGLSIHHDGDLPAKSGMGSSSAFVVGLLHAMRALNGHDRIDKGDLAHEAITVERGYMMEPGGWQDQIFAAHGGFNRIDFTPKDSYRITPISLSMKRRTNLLSHLMMVFTSFQRNAFELEHAKNARMEENLEYLHSIKTICDKLEIVLEDGNMEHLGYLLNKGWELKKALADNVCNPLLDEIYNKALQAGAYGGKLLGAGGGGYFLFVVPPERWASVKDALSSLIEVPVGIDYYGSRVMRFEPNGR